MPLQQAQAETVKGMTGSRRHMIGSRHNRRVAQPEPGIFMTDVEGVLRAGKLVSAMSVDEAGRLISEGVIDGGMIPKVEAILHGLAHGVASAAIISGNDHHAIIAELFTDKGIGTIITS